MITLVLHGGFAFVSVRLIIFCSVEFSSVLFDILRIVRVHHPSYFCCHLHLGKKPLLAVEYVALSSNLAKRGDIVYAS